MKKVIIKKRTGIHVNESIEGFPLERKLADMMENNEPIGDEVPLIFTEKKDGVRADCDIRTDRWDIALSGMNEIQERNKAKRMEGADNDEKIDSDGGQDGLSNEGETP